MNDKIYPQFATIDITNKCNSMCKMCNVWQLQPKNEISLDVLKKIPSTLKYINVTGGEPFLHERIVDIIQILHETCPKAVITISTNGLATELVASKVTEILQFLPDLHIGISIDGNLETHNKIRNVPNAFERATSTIDTLKQLGVQYLVMDFTIQNDNWQQINDVYKLSKEKGARFVFTYAQNSDIYFMKMDNKVEIPIKEMGRKIKEIERAFLQKPSVENWGRAFFFWGVYRSLKGYPIKLNCSAGDSFFFLNCQGKLFACMCRGDLLLGDLSGNISFDDIWFGKWANRIRRTARRCRRNCWMVCTALPWMYRHKLEILRWGIWNSMTSIV